ncbi:flavodoxin family protein [Anderseniella sp. Alg231-50]|uniref:flavodoxin family protein n=1 Tax=Anderseniella sp. Alg231-50 TaxID=1922226 RepID=UPI00307C9A0A
MRTLIIYYSRTGTTATIASALANRLDADKREIGCDRYTGGLLRYLQAGYDSVRGNLPEIEMAEFAAEQYDLVLIGTPVWTSHPALPVRALLARKPDLPARVAVFLTHGGHSPPQTCIDELAAMLPVPVEASLTFSSAQVSAGKFTDDIDGFASELESRTGQ